MPCLWSVAFYYELNPFYSSIEVWYLHGPDRVTPFEVTLKAVNDLYKEGKFKRFGISNYMSCVRLSLVSCVLKSL